MDKNHCNMHLLTPAGSNKKLGARDPFVKLVIDQEGVKFVSFKKKKKPYSKPTNYRSVSFRAMQKRPMWTWKVQTSTFYVFSYFFLHQTLEEGQEDEVREKRLVDSSTAISKHTHKHTVKRALTGSTEKALLEALRCIQPGNKLMRGKTTTSMGVEMVPY